ncbi:MAG TPA: hypothetical protein VLV76_27845 [Candidatus Acidoferrum sp.]|nr:hypothetical protein [Candidatus Acidoferrum sp.]
MTDEHSVENRPDSDLASGKRARRALPQLWAERRTILLLAAAAVAAVVVLLLWAL